MKEQLIKGISSYQHEQDVLLRVIRKYNELSEVDFDRIFSGELKKLRFFMGMDSLLLGTGNYAFDYWAKWLSLAQIMIAIGLIKTKKVNGKVYYFLTRKKNEKSKAGG